MATQQIEINIPIFERNLKLFNKKGLRRAYTSVYNHASEYLVVPPLSCRTQVVMEVTLDKEYVNEFQEILKNEGFEVLGSDFVFHMDNLIKDFEASRKYFEDRLDQFENIKKEREARLQALKPYEEIENDDVRFYFFPYNEKVENLYEFIKVYKEKFLAYAKEKDITIMFRPQAFSNQLQGFFGFNFFDADAKEEVVVDYASRLTVNVDFDSLPTVYAAAVLLTGIGLSKEELADKDLNVHLISENLKYTKA